MAFLPMPQSGGTRCGGCASRRAKPRAVSSPQSPQRELQQLRTSTGSRRVSGRAAVRVLCKDERHGAPRAARNVRDTRALAHVVAHLDRDCGRDDAAALHAAGMECAPLEGNTVYVAVVATQAARGPAPDPVDPDFWRGVDLVAAARGIRPRKRFPVVLLCGLRAGGAGVDSGFTGVRDYRFGGRRPGLSAEEAREGTRAALREAGDLHDKAAYAAGAATAQPRRSASTVEDLATVRANRRRRQARSRCSRTAGGRRRSFTGGYLENEQAGEEDGGGGGGR